MAKKKDSQALFELISKNREKRLAAKLSVPEWMGSTQPTPPAGEEAPAPGPAEPDAAPETPPPAGLPSKTTPKAKPERRTEPLLVLGDNRLTLSLSFLSAGVAGLGLLVLLLGAFWLGRHTAPESGEVVASAGGNGQEKGKGQDASAKKQTGQGNNGPTGAGLMAGRYYLVIETLQGTGPEALVDAQKIQEFCTARGVPATRVWYTPPGRPKRLMVWSLKPFAKGQVLDGAGPSPEAVQHATKIEGLGREYSQAGGKYAFKQRRRPTDPPGYFLLYSKPK